MPPTHTTRTSRSRAPTNPSVGKQPEMQGQPPSQQDQEVDQNEGKGESQVRSQQPPLPPFIDLAQVINNQTLVLEALANAINRSRPCGQGMNEKLTDFLRTKPPTFGGSANPLDADDWLRVIQRKLEPFGCEDRDKVLLAAHQLTCTTLALWRNTVYPQYY